MLNKSLRKKIIKKSTVRKNECFNFRVTLLNVYQCVLEILNVYVLEMMAEIAGL